MAWAVNSLSAEYLSACMLGRGRVSLNEIAAQATFSLIRRFQEQGMNVSQVKRGWERKRQCESVCASPPSLHPAPVSPYTATSSTLNPQALTPDS